MKDKISAISLFSGCGGLDIGSHMAGVNTMSCIDFDENCIKTLNQNSIFKKTEKIFADVTSYPSKKFKDTLKKNKYNEFIVIGGPPCQPFSKAGYWIGNKNRKGGNDPRNMVGEYFRIVEDLKPSGFLFENVESLLHPTNKHIIETIKLKIKELGYHYKIINANALDYGVPQKRKRIFIFGSKKKFSDIEPKKTHGVTKEINDKTFERYVSVGEVINRFDKKKYYEPEEVAEGGTYFKDLLKVSPGKNYIELTVPPKGPHSKFEKGKRFWSFLLKLSPDLPSWTIAAQPGPWVGPFHWSSRRLRVPEIAAIQTFPEEYKFYGNRRSIQRQIGNAVPPLMGKAMVKYLVENL